MDPQLPLRHLDYTIIYTRDARTMRTFYGSVLNLTVNRELGPKWIEYRVGSSLLALTERGLLFDDPSPPSGALSVQLGFRVAPKEVDDCAKMLTDRGIAIVEPPNDQPWGHRTLFFRDPDGNMLEIYAEI